MVASHGSSSGMHHQGSQLLDRSSKSGSVELVTVLPLLLWSQSVLLSTLKRSLAKLVKVGKINVSKNYYYISACVYKVNGIYLHLVLHGPATVCIVLKEADLWRLGGILRGRSADTITTPVILELQFDRGLFLPTLGGVGQLLEIFVWTGSQLYLPWSAGVCCSYPSTSCLVVALPWERTSKWMWPAADSRWWWYFVFVYNLVYSFTLDLLYCLSLLFIHCLIVKKNYCHANIMFQWQKQKHLHTYTIMLIENW